MAKMRKKKKGTATRRTSPRRRAPPKRPSLLVLHVDANKLRADGLHFETAARITAGLVSAGLNANVAIEDAATLSELLSNLAPLAEAKRTFDVIVIVGHSNETGIRLDATNFVQWSVFAQYLKPFKPRRLLLVACRAGRWDAGEALFTTLRNLRRIYASPVNVSKDFASLMMFAVPYVVAERAPKKHHVTWAQVAAIGVTGRQLREWTRVADRGNPRSGIYDVFADALDPIAREVPAALASLIRRL